MTFYGFDMIILQKICSIFIICQLLKIYSAIVLFYLFSKKSKILRMLSVKADNFTDF
ncbi:hypothetical protein HDF25_000374 [Pedobacter cryoconitis]|uniref:Uncharacterized protein n=1 Tax=Pedobacter cryoconitis TaxID=188932 RepID=A0A7X0IZE3_9SPHI|nr:hypothetical protein [Pedobacter cryoconitis]